LVQNSENVRALLDAKDLQYVKIFASGDLDEFKISELLSKGAKIDAFGVGTKMGTSADYPYTDIIYKLCETKNQKDEFLPIMKLSKDKITLPGRKQVYRFTDQQGFYVKDIITLADEHSDGNPLLEKMINRGKLTYSLPDLKKIAEVAAKNVANLPETYRKTICAQTYPVELSQRLNSLIANLEEKIMKTEILDSKS
jgi:nicotinate phosphoribosyltransferase